jgi:3-isopropylmalate/(R)-2-methylmalate dehydratase small subunit
MEPIRQVTSKTVVMPTENIDTDQIIPARFLVTTSRDGLGKSLFADWRYDRSGQAIPDFALNRPEAAGARILIAGRNFGCGSSREHAVWALHDHGIRAVVSTSLADIFRRNALKNGLLAVVVEPEAHAKLLAAPGAEVTVDLESATVSLPDGGSAPFPIEPFARYCLMEGIDELQFLLAQGEAIGSHESAHGY